MWPCNRPSSLLPLPPLPSPREDDDRDLLRGLLRWLIIPQHKKFTLPLIYGSHRFLVFFF
jgi:hypothetical protein